MPLATSRATISRARGDGSGTGNRNVRSSESRRTSVVWPSNTGGTRLMGSPLQRSTGEVLRRLTVPAWVRPTSRGQATIRVGSTRVMTAGKRLRYASNNPNVSGLTPPETKDSCATSASVSCRRMVGRNTTRPSQRCSAAASGREMPEGIAMSVSKPSASMAPIHAAGSAVVVRVAGGARWGSAA
uniref:Uncharacterized protein n=1 Tax=Human herpesvirus 1 TaxID=10298 RepID=A0A2Z4GZS0_HHV1|nr:hypothetical protein [Human alphaherpesvirus 1]